MLAKLMFLRERKTKTAVVITQVAFVCMTLQEGATTTEGTPGPSTEPSQPATTTYGPVDCPSGWTEFQVGIVRLASSYTI